MRVHVQRGSIHETSADAIVVNLFRGVTGPGGATGAVDAALDGALGERIAAGDIEGRLGEVLTLYPRGAVPSERVLVVGLGSQAEFDAEAARRASAAAARACARTGAGTLASIVHGAGIGGMEPERAAQATAEGALLALYRYGGGAPDASDPSRRRLRELTLVELEEERIAPLERGARSAEAVAAGVATARDLVEGPPNVVTPSHLAQTARDLADAHHMHVQVGDRAWMEEHEMGALLAVARGAAEPPAFIRVAYGGDGSDMPPLVLVGKGITFDSGGLSIKSRTGMITMKSDMAGAAAVLGAMKTLAMLGVPRRVIGLLPCTENMPDGRAYRPSDVVRASDGTSIEIISTDAEGRLALADALAYARGLQPEAVVDVATLTSSSVRALGEGVAAALFSNDDRLAERIARAGGETFERAWRLPLYDDYRTTIGSDVADVKNSGGAKGGVGTSAVFLEAFTDYPWAHLDIAGMALSKKAKGYVPRGATGFGVRLLVEAVRRWDG